MRKVQCSECGSTNVVHYDAEDDYTDESIIIVECEDCGYREEG